MGMGRQTNNWFISSISEQVIDPELYFVDSIKKCLRTLSINTNDIRNAHRVKRKTTRETNKR